MLNWCWSQEELSDEHQADSMERTQCRGIIRGNCPKGWLANEETAVDYSNAAKACSTKAAHPSKTRYLSLDDALIISVRIEAQKGIVIGG